MHAKLDLYRAGSMAHQFYIRTVLDPASLPSSTSRRSIPSLAVPDTGNLDLFDLVLNTVRKTKLPSMCSLRTGNMFINTSRVAGMHAMTKDVVTSRTDHSKPK